MVFYCSPGSHLTCPTFIGSELAALCSQNGSWGMWALRRFLGAGSVLAGKQELAQEQRDPKESQ